MTTPASKLQKYTSIIKDALFLSSIIVTISTVAGSFVISQAWPVFIEKLKEDLNIATADDLLKLQTQINTITGDDRIIRMPEGHSFVDEPVVHGDPINLTLVLARTNHGQGCMFLDGTPLYTDERDIPFAGAPITPIKQLSNTPERLQLTLNLPETLQPGRIGMTIGMKFSCPFGPGSSFISVYDETDDIFFQMVPASN